MFSSLRRTRAHFSQPIPRRTGPGPRRRVRAGRRRRVRPIFEKTFAYAALALSTPSASAAAAADCVGASRARAISNPRPRRPVRRHSHSTKLSVRPAHAASRAYAFFPPNQNRLRVRSLPPSRPFNRAVPDAVVAGFPISAHFSRLRCTLAFNGSRLPLPPRPRDIDGASCTYRPRPTISGFWTGSADEYR